MTHCGLSNHTGSFTWSQIEFEDFWFPKISNERRQWWILSHGIHTNKHKALVTGSCLCYSWTNNLTSLAKVIVNQSVLNMESFKELMGHNKLIVWSVLLVNNILMETIRAASLIQCFSTFYSHRKVAYCRLNCDYLNDLMLPKQTLWWQQATRRKRHYYDSDSGGL